MNAICNTFANYDIPNMPNYLAIRERFIREFQDFLREKQEEAAMQVIQVELGNQYLFFQNILSHHIDPEAILEKPYTYLVMNSHLS